MAGGMFGGSRFAEVPAFERTKSLRRCEKIKGLRSRIANDYACHAARDFDYMGVGHARSFAPRMSEAFGRHGATTIF
jgi:hypothetical protein